MGYPGEDEHEHKRIAPRGPRLPSANDIKLGYPTDIEPAKEDAVIFGHPEVAGLYTRRYDHNDPFLSEETERTDLNYPGAEGVRKRSKGSSW